MTTNDIPAIRKLANRSTGTPWTLIEQKNGDRRILAVIADGHGDMLDHALVAEVPLEPGDDNVNDWHNDAEFIAAARQIVPDLADEVEQLRAELNEALPQITAAWTALNKAGFQSPVAGIAELIDELAAALADAEGRGTALAALLTKSREQAAKVHEQNAAAQNALRSLGQAYADLKTDNDELAAQVDQLRAAPKHESDCACWDTASESCALPKAEATR